MIKQSMFKKSFENTNEESNNDEKFSVSELIQYINLNKSAISSVNIVDLNSIKNLEEKELNKLNYRNTKQVHFLPTNLNELFDVENNKYLHSGVLQNIPSCNNNISFYSSLLICLKPAIFSQESQYQKKIITALLECLKLEVNKFSYKKYGWNTNDLRKNVIEGVIGSNVIKYVSDYFWINIFILDIENDSLMYGGGDTFIPYKKNIFLIFHKDGSFEPFYNEKNKFFPFNDTLLQNILKNKDKVSVYKLSNSMICELNETEEDLELYLGRKKKISDKNSQENNKENNNNNNNKNNNKNNNESDNENSNDNDNDNESDNENSNDNDNDNESDNENSNDNDNDNESNNESDNESNNENSNDNNDNDNESNNENSNDNDKEVQDLSEKYLKKLKLQELQKIAKSRGIDIQKNKKNKTKDQLTNEIMSY
jgi:hypothetical protein